MAQSIKLWGATYSNVGGVKLPLSTSGTATFTDVTDTTAAASDVASGKYFYTSAGVRTQGTASGGGGGGLTLLATKSLGTISTTSTTATDTGQTVAVTGFDAYDTLIAVCHTETPTNNRHVATVRYIEFAATSDIDTKTSTNLASYTQNFKIVSTGVMRTYCGTTQYGLYVNSATISTGTPRTCTLTIYQRYNSTNTGTINGTYIMDVYGLKLHDLF